MRIIEIFKNDLIFDPKGCSDLLTKACTRGDKLYVRGLASNADRLFVLLEEEVAPLSYNEYCFAAMDGEDADLIDAEISSRYYAKFSLVGSFVLGEDEQLWALWARKE